ncbi:MAG: hypothetical protein IJQ47_10355 [Synergistaceae bacterium]|nr:hypothetical protein [Synergistaceae bacterium]
MKEIKYPELEKKLLTGNEAITGTKNKLIDYWAWAHSMLVDNSERGIFAEFLVHTAMKSTETIRRNWTSYDILSPEGIKIEVKASGYIQSWGQEKLSPINFLIRPTQVCNAEDNNFSGGKVRQADVYVFCVHTHTEQESINILDTSQWKFYVLSTATLNEKVGNQEKISLTKLKKLNPKETDYSGLRKAVLEAAGKFKI